MNIAAIIQARMDSTRLPGKVLMDLNGKPVLQRVIERTRFSMVKKTIVATTETSTKVVDLCKNLGIPYCVGSETDVMGRVLVAAFKHHVEAIVEITADCPLIDPEIINECIKRFMLKGLDYVSNCVPDRTYPDGLDVQVYKTSVLAKVYHTHRNIKHVGWNIPQHNSYNWDCLHSPKELYWPNLRVTLDTIEDYRLINNIYKHFGEKDFDSYDVVRYLRKNPELLNFNKHIQPKDVQEG